MQEFALGMPTLTRMRRTAAESNMENHGQVMARTVWEIGAGRWALGAGKV